MFGSVSFRVVLRAIRRSLLEAPAWRGVAAVGLVLVFTFQGPLAEATAEPQSSDRPQASSSSRAGGQGHTTRIRPKGDVKVHSLPPPRRGGPKQAKPLPAAPRLGPPAPPSRPGRPVVTGGLAPRAKRTTASTNRVMSPSSATLERLTTFPTLGNVNSKVPSDTQLAVGPTYIVQMVNVSGQIYDKAGNAVGSAFDLGSFFLCGAAGMGTDPRVHYDAGSGRFFAAYECLTAGGDETDVAVSDDSDPRGQWTVYDVADNSSNVLQDQEKLGYTNDKVTLSWNNYDNTQSPAAFLGVVTAVINKAELLAGGTITISTFSQDSGKFQVVPATSLSSVNDQFAMWHGEGSTDVNVITITGVPGVSAVNQSENSIGIGTADSPPAAAQPSGGDPTITTNDSRMLSTAWQNNHLWGVFNVKCTPPDDSTMRACQRYIQVSTDGGQSLATNFNLGLVGGDIYFGSVALNDEDDLFSGFTASSSSMYATGVAIGVPGGNFQPVTPGDFFYAGTQAYVCGCGTVGNPPVPKERWGDYSGTARDPSNPKDVWTVQQAGGFAGGDWGTAMDRVTLSPPTVSGVSPNHAPELSSCTTNVTVTGTEFVAGNTTVKFGAASASNVSVNSPNQLTADAPSQARGTVDVTVTTPNGTSPTSSADQFTYDPDTTSPTTTAAVSPAPIGGWNKGLVTVNLNATDNVCGSGVKNITYSASGAQTIGPTTVPVSSTSVQISNEGITTVSFFATDNANNVESTKTQVVRIDNTPPTITIITPAAGAAYILHEPVTANYGCTDSASGLATCIGTVVNGTPIDTASLGTKTFTVNATDNVGNASSQSVTYYVTYKICLQYDPAKPSGGRAYQIKIQLCDYNNVNLSDMSITVTATAVDGNPALLKALGTLNPGNVFLYGPGTAPGASYTYNLDTLGLPSGMHVLNFVVQGDLVSHTAPFIFK